MKIAVIIAALIGTALAAGPYVSYTEYSGTGCNATATNYVDDLYDYPADGSCFQSTGGLTTSYSITISVLNSSYINITMYNDDTCTNDWYDYVYAVDACVDSDTVFSIWQEIPDDDYWGELGITGWDGPWETYAVINYFDAAECPEANWLDTEIYGWEECDTGYHIYCDDDEGNVEFCTDTTDCASGCTSGTYEPLPSDCTASSEVVGTYTYWTTVVDYYYSTSFQSTCYGGDSASSTLVASVAVTLAALALVF